MWQAIECSGLHRGDEDVWDTVCAGRAEDGDGQQGQGEFRLVLSSWIVVCLLIIQARRFITFIDACYESKVRLFLLSQLCLLIFRTDQALRNFRSPDIPSIFRGRVSLETNIGPYAECYG